MPKTPQTTDSHWSARAVSRIRGVIRVTSEGTITEATVFTLIEVVPDGQDIDADDNVPRAQGGQEHAQ